jgi:hypothetical protein
LGTTALPMPRGARNSKRQPAVRVQCGRREELPRMAGPLTRSPADR